MKIKITEIAKEQPELLEIHCHGISDEVREIMTFVKSRQGQLTGIIEGTQYEVPVSDIVYIEAVDNKCFLYSRQKVFESRQKLYELEKELESRHFLRISKSMLINLMAVCSIKPALNGRMTAVLQTDEQVIISRKYVPELKKALKGGGTL